MITKNILKTSAALLLATTSLVGYSAEHDIAQEVNGIALGARLGSLGVGAEVTYAINDLAAVRVNGAYLPLLNKDLKYDGTIHTAGKLTGTNINGMALVDWHPFANAFRLSAGVAYNRLSLSAQDVTINFSGVDTSSFKTLANDAATAVKALGSTATAAIDAVDKVVTAVTANMLPVVGPIKFDASLDSKFAPVLAFGADNTNDVDASFVYGFDVAFMLVNPKLVISDNSTYFNFTSANSANTIGKAAGAAAANVASAAGASKETTDLAQAIITQSSLGALSLKTFGQDSYSLFANKMVIPAIMGHIAIPLQ